MFWLGLGIGAFLGIIVGIIAGIVGLALFVTHFNDEDDKMKD